MKVHSHQRDRFLRDAVLSQIDFEAEVLPMSIGVGVEGGVVTLTGFVNTHMQRVAAEKTATRVRGVKAVANDLQVKKVYERNDQEVAKDAVGALEAHVAASNDRIKLTVMDGWITVGGSVDLESYREEVESALRHLRGVKGVTNLVEVTRDFVRTEVKTQIEEALRLSGGVDARRIIVDTGGGTVRLGGHACSLAEKKEAERVAWTTPGVGRVENYILVVQ
jgi:osmotically-inducible protein OsmY